MTDSSHKGPPPAEDELERLRDLILGEEKTRLQKLDWRVADLESRTADVAEVLPGAMSRLVDDPVKKPDLEKPIVETIQNAIQRDTASFAEALFPVLGPAIRRAVADSLYTLVQRINVALENSFTVKGLKWRIESIRTGMPFAQVVLRHTMLYAVQEAFLIQRKSGLVLASVHRDETLALDEDAVSAMLTAIQSFIQDSLGLPNDEPLRSAELGDRTLWVINGPEALLACIITGSPPREVRTDLMQILETLHAQFGKRFGDHPELLSQDTGLNALLDQSLREEVDEEARGAGSPKYKLLWGGLGVLLLAFLLWSGWHGFHDRSLERQVAATFAAEPGYVLTAGEARRGELRLAGLQDPVARPPRAVLESAGIRPDAVTLALRPYQSLEKDMVLQRLAGALGNPAGVTLALDGARLRVEGSLSPPQYALLEALPASHPVISEVDLAGSRLAAGEAQDLIRRTLGAPQSVTLTADGATMRLGGSAPARWFREAAAGPATIGGWALDFAPLRDSLTRELGALRARLDGQRIDFTRASRITEDSLADLDPLAGDLARALDLAAAVGAGISVRLEGYADGVGTPERNEEVALDRARAVQAELAARGVDGTALALVRGPWTPGDVDLERRRVILRIEGAPGE